MSKYVNLASKIIDLVHAEHKAGLRAERKKTAEAKAKKVKELDPTVDDENPGFKDKEQEAIKAKSKEESEDDEKEDEDDDPVGKKKDKKDDDKDGDKDKESDDGDEKKKDAVPPKDDSGTPPASDAPAADAGSKEPEGDEGPDPTKQSGREISTGAVDIQKKPSPPMPGNKKTKKGGKVEMSGKKEKVDTKPKTESIDDMIRKREEYLKRPKFNAESLKRRITVVDKMKEIDAEFGIKEKMIAEGMWDGNISDDMEIYGKPEITQLQLWRMLEMYRAAGMNLEQSCDTIEYLYGVRPMADDEGNMNFGGTQMDFMKYGRNDAENRASY